MKFPKILHLYWGNTPMSYLQYLTATSFHFWNPEWKIFLWHPGTYPCTPAMWVTDEHMNPYTGEDWREKVFALPFCEKIEVPFDEWDIPIEIHDVFRSDFVRWNVLWRYGGAWSDFDILYLRPLHFVQLNGLDTADFTYATSGSYSDGFSFLIGFHFSKKDNEFFKAISNRAKFEYNPSLYQSLGSGLVVNFILENCQEIVFDSANPLSPKHCSSSVPCAMPLDYVYPFSWAQITHLFKSTVEYTIPDKTVGVHWFNGTVISRDYVNRFSVLRNNGSILSRFVQKIENLMQEDSIYHETSCDVNKLPYMITLREEKSHIKDNCQQILPTLIN